MQIRTITHDLELAHTFTIARSSQDVSRVAVATIAHGGVSGRGEACPSDFYSETAETVIAALERLSPWIETESPVEYTHFLEEAAERLGPERAALSALDLAVHDWFGRRVEQPLYRLLGLDIGRIPRTSFTIGIDDLDVMVEKLREAKDHPIIKIKLGMPNDIELVRTLRAETEAIFRVDANCAWTPHETIEKSTELAALGVEFIEQPLPPEDLDGMDEVFAKSALPVIADENSVVPRDVPSLRGKFHGINIKLVKCGGIKPALEMIHIARALDLRVMIGCMVDSSLSATAAAQIGALADYLDLDGPLLIKNDPYRGLEYIDGRPMPLHRPGLGVEPNPLV